MRNIDLAGLEIFKAVAEQGGITRAAARLHRVQSNVTTRVKQLEERLGTALFLRERGRLRLSAQGRVLLDYADRLLHLSAEAEAALRDGRPAGTLRLGALESTAATRLPPVLSAFHRAYPDVRVELVTGTSGALVRASRRTRGGGGLRGRAVHRRRARRRARVLRGARPHHAPGRARVASAADSGTRR